MMLVSLVAWLKAQGFDVVKQTLDGTGVYAQRYRRSDRAESWGQDGPSYQRRPHLYGRSERSEFTSEVAGSVHAIIGLQPFRQAHKHNRKRVPKGGNRASLCTKSAAGALSSTTAAPSPNIANAPPYLVPEILKGYNADGLSVSGKGQKIAILIDTFPNDTDLHGVLAA